MFVHYSAIQGNGFRSLPEGANCISAVSLNLAQRDGQHALAEFEKILGHPYLYKGETNYSLSQLGAARAAALINNPALSRHHYEEFFASWANADGDLPALAAAKREYAAITDTARTSRAAR